MQLSKSQSATLSNFFNDVAKGLFLATAVNQAIPSAVPLEVKLGLSIMGVLVSIICLYLAVSFSNSDEKTW